MEAYEQLYSSRVNFPNDPLFQTAERGRLQTFGLFRTVDFLAGGDATKWEAVMGLDNSTVLIKMQMSSVEAHVDKDYRAALDRQHQKK